ncbi:MAG: galactose-1-phosphate uridylyltransferase, partial [Candidatus Ornithomonoglobus sp.]
IKKENIGLIEVMGLAVLPSRLVEELDAVADAILNKKDLDADAKTVSHAEWVRNTVIPAHPEINKDNIKDILKEEVGRVFVTVLEHAGVYKRNAEGMAAFDKFVAQL